MDVLTVHRLHFAFTVTFHYIFPQLTMGLALLILVLKTMALRTGDEHYARAARFWAKILAINFAMGVVTGIPMEFPLRDGNRQPECATPSGNGIWCGCGLRSRFRCGAGRSPLRGCRQDPGCRLQEPKIPPHPSARKCPVGAELREDGKDNPVSIRKESG